jgi:hypothetical protein
MNQPVVSTYVEYGEVYKARLLFASGRQLLLCSESFLSVLSGKNHSNSHKSIQDANETHPTLIQSKPQSLINPAFLHNSLENKAGRRKHSFEKELYSHEIFPTGTTFPRC